MKLDFEKQRELLTNCIMSAELTGMVAELFPQLTEISALLEAVKKATVEEGEIQKENENGK